MLEIIINTIRMITWSIEEMRKKRMIHVNMHYATTAFALATQMVRTIAKNWRWCHALFQCVLIFINQFVEVTGKHTPMNVLWMVIPVMVVSRLVSIKFMMENATQVMITQVVITQVIIIPLFAPLFKILHFFSLCWWMSWQLPPWHYQKHETFIWKFGFYCSLVQLSDLAILKIGFSYLIVECSWMLLSVDLVSWQIMIFSALQKNSLTKWSSAVAAI